MKMPQKRRTIRVSQLRALISEETKKILLEAEGIAGEKEAGEDSIDSQIDSYFSDYESEAKNLQKEGKDFRSLVRRFLREAPKDEEEVEEEETEEKEEPKKLTIDDVNVDSFASSVVRLIDNYDSLLEVRNTILRRAVNFLAKSYEKDVVDSFKEIVQERHGMEIGKSKAEIEDEEFQPPAADRAGASPGA
jgi:hypothetical protein